MMKFLTLCLIAYTALMTTPAAVVAQDVSVDAPQVQLVDARERTVNDARTLAADASVNKVAIVVWGGSRPVQQEAYFAARDLAGAGIPVAFIVAPQVYAIDSIGMLEIYGGSTPRTEMGVIAPNGIERIRRVTRDGALNVVRDLYPEQLRNAAGVQ